MPEEWTSDSSKAQHFTEWGAKRHAKELEAPPFNVKGPLRATEHMDCIGPDIRLAEIMDALRPLARIPIEQFGWSEKNKDRVVMGFNDTVKVFVRDVLAARAVLAKHDAP